MDKATARLQALNELPDDTVILIKKGDLYWRYDGRGYAANLGVAKVFTKQEVIEGVRQNSFMDKEIVIYTPAKSI